MADKTPDLSGFPYDIAEAIINYRKARENLEGAGHSSRVFTIGGYIVGALSIFFIAIYPFTRYPIWPAILLVAMAIGFLVLGRYYAKKVNPAKAAITVAELELRELIGKLPAEEQKRILKAAGIPISLFELDQLRPSDFE